MAKRIKPKNLLDDSEISIDTNSSNALDVSKPIANDDVLLTNAEQNDNQREDLQKTIVELTEKNSQLEIKLAEYIEAATCNSNKFSKYDELEKENVRLAKENKILRDEVDSYLVKISELTFENAAKTCQIQELQKAVNSSPNNPTNPLQRPGGVVNSPQATNLKSNAMFNGYSSWN